MTLHSTYRESIDPALPHPRTLVPYHVRLVLGIDDLVTRLALLARSLAQNLSRVRGR
jgi:hypothetical protein